MEIKPRSIYLKTAALIAAGTLLASCGESEASTDEVAPEICATDNFHALPSVAEAPNVEDDREGDIYACQYLNDARLPVNTPSELYSLTNEIFDSEEFTKQGSFGGWMFIGIGEISGNSTESGETVRKRLNVVKVQDQDGNLQTLILDAEKVKLRPCPEDCPPTVEIKVSDTPLWHKDGDDNSSIWYSNLYSDSSGDRQRVVRAVGLYLGDKDNYPPDEDPLYGSARAPGEIVSSLASEVIVSLPESDINE